MSSVDTTERGTAASPPLTRRTFLLGAVTTIPLLRPSGLASIMALPSLDSAERFTDIEYRSGGRLGVAALDTANGRQLDYRSDDLFPMCSTFKFLAAAATLKRVDDDRERLERNVSYSEKDLLEYAPITKQHVTEGSLTVAALCAAAIEYSDNTAGNLLLRGLGGPAGITHFARSIGDTVTRLDRTEPTLNTALPNDPRDTTTPDAMLHDLEAILLGAVLSVASKQNLIGWLVANTTGAARLRAGVPSTWRVGDKTGTGARGASGDVAIMWPLGRKPVLVATYLTETGATAAQCSAVLRDIGRVVAETFA
ncbi:MAG: class A beta-lactamase [Gemmatimonadaceae bacterium]